MPSIDSRILRSRPTGFRAVVIGANGGIGSAISDLVEVQQNLGQLIRLSRAKSGFDLTDEQSVADHAAEFLDRPIHLLVCATGILTVDSHAPREIVEATKT